jgi:hypothetical protein
VYASTTVSRVDVQAVVSFSTFEQFFCARTPDCPASDHSGTKKQKKGDAGTSSVPE